MDHRALLAGLVYTPERLAERRNWIGASDTPRLMSGSPQEVLDLWAEKRGEREPEDLSDNLNVMMGLFTEPLNAAWFEKKTGRLVEARGKVAFSPAFDFMRASLDGLTDGGITVWQAKHTNSFWKMEDVVRHYMPQVHHEMHCAQVDRAVLSVLRGNSELQIVDVRRDDWYLAQLIEAERNFWDCVQTGREPVAVEPAVATDAVEAVRTVDMTGNNAWASAAADWIENRPAAALFEDAVKLLKELIPRDAKIVHGHGIKATRAKNGAVKISMDEVGNA